MFQQWQLNVLKVPNIRFSLLLGGKEKMKKMKVDAIKIEDDKKKVFINAKESLRKMQEEIAPFIRKRKIRTNSNVGKWYDSTS